MDDFVHWLGEQLDEYERIARAAGGRSEQTWQADVSGVDPIGGKSWPLVVRYVTGDQLRGAVAHLPVMQERSEYRMAHIAAHDPARVLREIDAKRQTLADLAAAEERMDEASRDQDTAGYNAARAEWTVLRRIVRRDAAVYADRPGYREEWRP